MDRTSQRRRVAAAALCVVVLASLIGCAATGRHAELSGTRVGLAETEAGSGPPHLTGQSWNAVSWPVNGPHHQTEVIATATANELTADDARTLGIEAVRAAPGEQLLLLALDPTRTRAALWEQSIDLVRAEVLVGGTATVIDQLPHGPGRSRFSYSSDKYWRDSVVLVVGARPDASVRLRMTDAGGEQELDLRTGRVDEPNGPYRERFDSTDWKLPTRASLCPERQVDLGEGRTVMNFGGPLLVTLQPNEFFSVVTYLTTYHPEIGWAAPGRAFLAVPALKLAYNRPYERDCGVDWTSLREEFDDADVYSFRTAGGGLLHPRPLRRDIRVYDEVNSYYYRDNSAHPVVFDVPVDTTTGSVVADLSRAQLTTTVGSHRQPITWARSPELLEWSVGLYSSVAVPG